MHSEVSKTRRILPVFVAGLAMCAVSAAPIPSGTKSNACVTASAMARVAPGTGPANHAVIKGRTSIKLNDVELATPLRNANAAMAPRVKRVSATG